MKRRANLLLLVLPCIFLVIILTALQLSRIDPKAHTKWAQLLDASHAKASTWQEHPLRQSRKKVSKELHLNGPISYARIDADYSLLALSPQKRELLVNEQFERVIALIQDKRFYLLDQKEVPEETAGAIAMQSIRVIKAKKGQLDYQGKKLHGEEVELYSYYLPDHCPPTHIHAEPYMIAKADHLSLDVENGSLLSCQQFVASMKSEDESENMRYISAPIMIYSPKEELMRFIAKDEEPVYFYDLGKQLALSAQEVEGIALFQRGRERIHATKSVHLIMQKENLEKLKEKLCRY